VITASPTSSEQFLAGLLAHSRDFSMLLAPNINSYKRFVAGSFAPTALLWDTTTAPARFASSVTARHCASSAGSPVAT